MITRSTKLLAAVAIILGGCSSIPSTQEALNRWYPNAEYYEGLTIENLTAEASEGSKEAKIELALRLMNGDQTARDETKAVSLLKELVDSDDPRAQYLLGAAYFQGASVELDPSQGLALLQEASDAGYDIAQYWYGYMLSRGRGIPEPDWKEAVHWLRKSANQGNPDAQFLLGEAIESCRGGLERNFKQAADWYRQATRHQNNVIASHNLRRLIEVGLVQWQDGDPGVRPEKFANIEDAYFPPCE